MRVLVPMLTNGDLSGGLYKMLLKAIPLIVKDKRVAELRVLINYGTAKLFLPPGIDYEEYGAGISVSDIINVRKIAKKFNPDVVFIPNLLYVDTGFPTVVMACNTMPFLDIVEPGNIKGTFYNVLRRTFQHRAAVNADRIIAVSDFIKELVIDKWAISNDKIDTVYHGIDPVHFEHKNNDSTEDKTLNLLSVGSLVKYRGIEDVINAIPALINNGINPVLEIIGSSGSDTNYEFMLKKLIDKYGINKNVKWLGTLPNAQVIEKLNEIDIFVMSSRMEACPNTALEAMAAGAVIISTDSKAMPEIFEEAAAYYYKANDSIDLAKKIILINSLSKKEKQNFADKAVERSRFFSWDIAAEKIINILLGLSQNDTN